MAIPFLPGVPALKTGIARTLISTGTVALLDSLLANPANQIWGVFDAKGKKVLFPDSFLGIDYHNNSRVSDYPVESGAFASYNKIATPYDAVVTVSKGGSKEDRAAFAKSLDSLINSFQLYTIVTPEESFANATIETYGYSRRPSNGANLLVVDINFTEIRPTPSVRYSSTRDGSALSTTVPDNQKTQATTSTGLSNPTAVTQASAQSNINNGAVSATASPASSGVIQ